MAQVLEHVLNEDSENHDIPFVMSITNAGDERENVKIDEVGQGGWTMETRSCYCLCLRF